MTKKPKLTESNWKDALVADIEELADVAPLLEQNELTTLGALADYQAISATGIAALEDGEDTDQEIVTDYLTALRDAHPEWFEGAEVTAEAPEDTPADAPPEPTAAEQEHGHYTQIRESAERVSELGEVYTSLKEQAADAKKTYDGAAAELIALIRRGPRKPDPQMTLPFPEDGDEPAPEASTEPVDDTAWLDSITTEMVGIPATLREKLAENVHPDGRPWPINTWGDLERWRVDYELTDVKGIGATKATKIQALFDAYLEANPRPAPAQPQRIRLRIDVPGYDNDAAGLYAGAIVPVSSWEGPLPRIESGQDIITLDLADFEAA